MLRLVLFAALAVNAGPQSAPFPAPAATPTKKKSSPSHQQTPVAPKATPTKRPTQSVPHTPKAKPRAGGTRPGAFGRAITVSWKPKDPKVQIDARFGKHAAGLSSFDLAFDQGDHKIQRIGVYHSEGKVYSELKDLDGNDPFWFKATFHDLPGIVAKKTQLNKRCQVVCDLKIDPPKKGETLVLTGFLFMRTQKDRDIHRIAVLPMPEFGVVRVVFDDGRRPEANSVFKTQIHYAYLPKSLVGRSYAETRRSPKGKSLGLHERKFSKRLIRAFDVQFSGAHHHLRRLRVEKRQNLYKVDLQDRSGDDSFNASVEYVVLR